MRSWLFIVALAWSLPVFGSGPSPVETLRGTILQKVLRDRHLAKLDGTLHGPFTRKNRFELDPFFDKPIQALKDGKVLLVTCCGGDTELQLHDAEAPSVK